MSLVNTQSVIKLQSPFERLKIENPCPEIALARAIILQAIIDASGTSSNTKEKKIRIEAEKWLFTKNENFLSICQDADFEPDYIRNIAKEMISLHRKKQHTTHTKHAK